MKAHNVTVINCRTRGLAPMMMGNLRDEDSNLHARRDESVESEDGERYRLEIRNGKKVFTESRHEANAKEEGRVKLTENVSAVDALVTSEQIAEPKLTSMEDPLSTICAQRETVLEIARPKKQRPHKMCRWGPSIWGPLK